MLGLISTIISCNDLFIRYRDVILVDGVETMVIKQIKYAIRKCSKMLEPNGANASEASQAPMSATVPAVDAHKASLLEQF